MERVPFIEELNLERVLILGIERGTERDPFKKKLSKHW